MNTSHSRPWGAAARARIDEQIGTRIHSIRVQLDPSKNQTNQAAFSNRLAELERQPHPESLHPNSSTPVSPPPQTPNAQLTIPISKSTFFQPSSAQQTSRAKFPAQQTSHSKIPARHTSHTNFSVRRNSQT
jgi:hypothetical protein